MSDVRYFDLTISAHKRLALMRQSFAQHSTKYPHCPEHLKPASWRDSRGYTLKNWRAAFCYGLNPGFNGEGFARVPVWYSHGGEQFRGEAFAHDCEGGPDHTGWHTNHDGATYRDGSGLARGIVGRLPHGRFIAGYWWGDNGERVYFAEIFDNERDAARAADSHAESFAEECRDDSERHDAMRDAEDEEQTARDAAMRAIQARNVSAWHREQARDKIQELRDARETLKERTETYEKGGK